MRPAPARIRLWLAVATLAPVMTACDRQSPAPASSPSTPVVEAAPPPTPLAPSTLDRAALLQALDLAAAAHAAGTVTAEADGVVGRRFLIRQAFGCFGSADSPAPGLARWSWGRERKTIEITLKPVDWTADPLFQAADARWEAVEGVWIARPWLRSDSCPAAAAPQPQPDHAASGRPALETLDGSVASPPAPVADPQIAGLAAVFEEGGSRLGRRDGKPFGFTLRSEDNRALAAPRGGFRLVIEGRFVAFPSGRAIRCRAASPDIRPVCVAAAEVDRVAFEDADGKSLREWRPG